MELNTLVLPEAFVARMREQLGEEADAFFDSYRRPRAYGLRRNPLKLDETAFLQLMPWELTHIPWAMEGYYYKETQRPGKHPYHEMGLYYIQEPSAMSVAEILDPQPGELILDLCAAPGGKSTQTAGRMAGEGLLVCNEIIPSRAKILSQNIERCGIKNAVVLNHAPGELSARFPLFFDRIIVDAPCSGEGMFHKQESALTEWSEDNVNMCAGRQREILACAYEMLREGGVLVYSTCTFAPAEDEEMVRWLLDTYEDLSILPIDTQTLGISKGELAGTARIWPHRQRGEGHFIARLKKEGTLAGHTFSADIPAKKSKKRSTVPDIWEAYEAFAQQYLRVEPSGRREQFGDQLYLVPKEFPNLQGLKVLRPGLHVGTVKKNRFEPSHALAMALLTDQVAQTVQTADPEQYLSGMTFSCDESYHGWVLVTYQGLPLGWGKASHGIVKNHYPKGLRIGLGVRPHEQIVNKK